MNKELTSIGKTQAIETNDFTVSKTSPLPDSDGSEKVMDIGVTQPVAQGKMPEGIGATQPIASGSVMEIGVTQPVAQSKVPEDIGATQPIASGSVMEIGVTQPVAQSKRTVAEVGVTRPIAVNKSGSVGEIGVTKPIPPKHSTPKCEEDPLPAEKKKNIVGSQNIAPITGWLVCTDGPYKHQGFTLHDGYNYIGSSPKSDIRLTNVDTNCDFIAMIGYDSFTRSFSIGLCGSHTIVRVNKHMIMESTPLHMYDTVSIGQSSFVFMPLCGEKFSWDI